MLYGMIGPSTIVSGGGGTFTPSSSQALAFFNRVATITGTGNPTYGITATERNAYDTMISGMVSDGIWSLLDALYIFATTSAATRAVALMNLVSSSYTCVEHTVGAGQFTADQGYTGVSGGYLDTQFDPTALSGQKYKQSDAGIWAWSLTNWTLSDYGSMLGNGSGTLNDRLYPYFSGSFYPALNQSGLTSNTLTPGHFYGITRDPANSGSAQYSSYVDVASQTVATASSTPVGPTLVLLNDGTTASAPFLGNMACAAIGGGFNSTQQAALYARIHAYMQAVAGAP